MRTGSFASTRTWPGRVELEGSHVVMDSETAVRHACLRSMRQINNTTKKRELYFTRHFQTTPDVLIFNHPIRSKSQPDIPGPPA